MYKAVGMGMPKSPTTRYVVVDVHAGDNGGRSLDGRIRMFLFGDRMFD